VIGIIEGLYQVIESGNASTIFRWSAMLGSVYAAIPPNKER
jgi:hypothetical protein